MIDWVSAVVPWYTREPIFSDRVCCITPDGEVKWETPSFLHVQGSGSSSISIRSHPSKGGFVEFSGNPVKFLQGHNLVGSSDLLGIMFACLKRVSEALNIPIPPEELEAIGQGRYRVTRVDVNAMWQVGTSAHRADVLAWLRAVGTGSRLAGRVGRLGRGLLKGDTCYWGKSADGGSSRYVLIKAYCKAQEVEVKGRSAILPDEIADDASLWLQNLLRVEVTFRSKYLDQNELSEARNWYKRDLFGLMMKHVREIEVSGAQIDPEKLKLLETMPKPVKMVYEGWLAGVDVRSNMPKATFYKYRKLLLPLGVDLSIRQGPDRSNVVPLIRVLEARPASVPEFFYKAGAVFIPDHQPKLRVVK